MTTAGVEEKELFSGSPSLLLHPGSIVLGLILLVGGLLGAGLHSNWFALAALAGLAIWFIQWAVNKTHRYEVTTQRIKETKGILTRRTQEMELYRVKDIVLVEPLFMRLFGLGTIEITTHDASTPLVKLEGVKKAKELRESLRNAVELCREAKGVRVTEFNENPIQPGK